MTKNKIGMIAIIALLVVMLAAVGIGLLFTVNSLRQITGDESSSVESVPTYTPEDLILYNVVDTIRSNLAPGSDDIDHLVLLQLTIALNSKEKKVKDFATLLEEKEAIIRDVTLRVLREKRFEELKKPNAQQLLGEELLSKLQTEFNTNIIVDVYFGEFLVQ